MNCKTLDIGGLTATICGLPRPKKCFYCSDLSAFLCDFPTGKTRKGKKKTCDRPLCPKHTEKGISRDVDFCREHFPIARRAFENKLLKKSFFIVQSEADNLSNLIEEVGRAQDATDSCWTSPAQVKVGDLMLIYLMRPISSIVGHAFFASEPFRLNDETSKWHGYRMATFEKLTIYDVSRFVSLRRLKELLPNWHWTTRPQGATKVPEIYKKEILELLI